MNISRMFRQERASAAQRFPAVADLTPAKVNKMKPVEILERAKACLGPKTWCKDTFNLEGKDGLIHAHCSLGALLRVRFITDDQLMGETDADLFGNFDTAHGYLKQAAQEIRRDPLTNVVEYNDAKGTSIKRVHRMFDKAIELASKA